MKLIELDDPAAESTPFVGAPVYSMNLALAAVPQDPRVISSGSSIVTNDPSCDANYQKTVSSGAVLGTQWQIACSGVYSGAVPFSLAYTTSNPAVCTVDEEGFVSFVGVGTALIEVTATFFINGQSIAGVDSISITNSTQGGASTTSYTITGYTAGTFSAGANDDLDSLLLVAAPPANSTRIFSTINHGTGVYVRNVNCWAAGYVTDLTAIAVANNSTGVFNGQRCVTALSPIHFACASHYPPNIGSTVRFVAADNTLVERTVVALRRVPFGSIDPNDDITIGKLNADLPVSISPMRVMPVDAFDYMRSLHRAFPPSEPGVVVYPRVACCFRNQQNELWVADGYQNDYSWPTFSLQAPISPLRAPFFKTAVGGDSGSPIMQFFDGQIALVTCFLTAGFGPSYIKRYNEINAAMTALGGGYLQTDADLTSADLCG